MFITTKPKNVSLALLISTLIFSTQSFAARTTIDAIDEAKEAVILEMQNTKTDLLNFSTAAEYNKNSVLSLEKTAPPPQELARKQGELSAKDFAKAHSDINRFLKDENITDNMSQSFVEYMLFNKNLPGSQDQPEIFNNLTFILDNHLKGYCNEQLLNKGSGLLSRDKLCQPGDPRFLYDDIDIGRALLNKRTLVPEEQTIAARAILNSTMGIPNNSLSKVLRDGPDSDPKLLVTKNKEEAAKLMARTAALSAINAFYTKMFEDRKAFPVQSSDGVTRQTSNLDLLHERISKTIDNPEWLQRVDESTDTALLKEMVLLTATANKLAYEKLINDQLNTAVLAAMISTNYISSLAVEKFVDNAGSAAGPAYSR